jgi:tetratricopeptide (TPR) repeat protein
MNRMVKFVWVGLLLLPVTAQAQRPSATMQTRSAGLYLERAEKTQVAPEREKLLKQALDLALEGVQKQSGNSKTWFTLGQVYAAMGDAVGADSAFDKAEAMWPDYAKETEQERFRAFVTAFNAGVAAIQQNNTAEAIAKLEAANRVYGKRPAASLNLGNLYSRANNIEKAAASYRQALDILRGPERKTLKPEEEKQWAQWEEAASFNLAQILATGNKDAEAVQAYQDYLARNPNHVIAKSNLAIVFSRMGKDAEAAKVYQELLSQDLSDEEYFQVGVGLFRAEKHKEAADAFRKAIAKNSSFRDAYYNLAQALYSQTIALEEQRSKGKIAEAKTFDAQLKPLYEELQTAAEKARELDPNNRNVLALLARAYRGMADVVDAKASLDMKNKTLAILKVHQELPFEITELSQTTENGETKLTGNVVNLKATAGQPISVTFTFLGKNGQVLGTQDVTVTAPKVEDQVPFTVSFKTTEALGGWKYAAK